MHLVRPSFLIAIAGLAAAATPAIAQQAPALPPVAGADYAQPKGDSPRDANWSQGSANDQGWHDAPAWGDGPPPPPAEHGPGPAWHDGPPPGAGGRPDFPPQPGEARMGYSREERAGWLDECTHRMGGEHAEHAEHDRDPHRGRMECEAYLERYEASYRGGGGYAQTWSYGGGYGGGYTPGAAPAGMMWVPIMMPAQNCCCAQKPKVRTIVTEEEVPQEVVTYERVPTKVVHTKYTKYTKTVPVKDIKQRPTKSTK